MEILNLIYQGGSETMAQMRRIAKPKPMSRHKQKVTVEMLLYSATPLPGSTPLPWANRVSRCAQRGLFVEAWDKCFTSCMYVF